MSRERRLDQAIDPHAQFYSDTADLYDDYLSGGYDYNYKNRTQQWDKHYDRVQSSFDGHIMNLLERGLVRDQMSIAIVGPGMDPVGKEWGTTAVEKVLPLAKNIVVVDFSTVVVRKAMEQIRTKIDGINDKVLGMQFDLTKGLSSAYDRMIRERLVTVKTEDDFYAMAKELDELSSEALLVKLRDTLTIIWNEKAEEGHRAVPDVLIGGKENTEGTLALTSDGEPVPIDTWFMPMVLAGMGAAAEHRIWDVYDSVTNDTHRGANPPSRETTENRRAAVERIYNLIARFNTIVATQAIQKILHYNPDSHILAVSDVSTVLKSDAIGSLTRLSADSMREALAKNEYDGEPEPITQITNGTNWEWHDEPDHHHGVNAFSFYRNPNTEEKSTTA